MEATATNVHSNQENRFQLRTYTHTHTHTHTCMRLHRPATYDRDHFLTMQLRIHIIVLTKFVYLH